MSHATSTIIVLSTIFLALFFGICRGKGIRSFFSLIITFFVLVGLFIPGLLHGREPLLLITICALPLSAMIIYLTEGFQKTAHIMVLSVAINFIIIAVFSWGVVTTAGLSGITSEEEASIQGYGSHTLDLPGILTAGIILGTLGAVTEMAVTQVATVSELRAAHPTTNEKSLFRQSFTIGVAHLGSMINTLFLIYASVSLPTLIILTSIGTSWHYIGTSELIQTECIRTLVGVICLVIAMPVATALAVSQKISSFFS